MMTTPLRPRSVGCTDVGLVRKINEDAMLDRGRIGLWVVADGMGGHQSGDLASRLICQRLAHLADEIPSEALEGAVLDAIEAAHRELRDIAARRGPHVTIGATVLALLIRDGHFATFWAGDSRLYRYRRGRLLQISRDHSHVQDLIESGAISREAAERHPHRNLLTRAIGVDMPLRLDKATDAVEAGDTFLLCTDGLFREVPEPTIAALIANTAFEQAPMALVQAALDGGGSDNVTVIVVRA